MPCPKIALSTLTILLNGEADPEKVIANQQALGDAFAVVLAEIKKYESNPTAKAAILSDPTIQQILHSFGDAYAHVRSDGTRFDPGIGHGAASAKSIIGYNTDPDDPHEHRDAYVSYALAIYEAAYSFTDKPRIGKEGIEKLANATADQKAESAQKDSLKNAITNAGGVNSSGLVISPVPDCGYLGCEKINLGGQANPTIKKIYGLPLRPSKSKEAEKRTEIGFP